MKKSAGKWLLAILSLVFPMALAATPLHFYELPFAPSEPHDFTSSDWSNKVVIHPEAFPEFELESKTYTLHIVCSGGIQLGTASWSGGSESDFQECGSASSDYEFKISKSIASRISGGCCFQLNNGSGTLSKVELKVTDGATVRPVAVGFHTSGTKLLDANGNEFVMRGLNYSYAWQENLSWCIKSTHDWGCNAIRINIGDGGQNWLRYTDYNTLSWLIEECENNNLIGVFAPHDETGSNSEDDLLRAARYWAGMADLLNEHTSTVLVNVTNEWMQAEDAEKWSAAYVKAIGIMRDAGIRNTIIVDVAGYGQGASVLNADGGKWAKAIIEADTEHNIMFSIHMYHVSGKDADTVKQNMDYGLALDVPLLIGEFAYEHKAHLSWPEGGRVAWQTVLDYCREKNVGYLAWSWTGNGGDAETCDMFDGNGNILTNGKCVIYGNNGIKMTSVECSVFSSDPGHDMAYQYPEGPFGFEPYPGYGDVVFDKVPDASDTKTFYAGLPYNVDSWNNSGLHIPGWFFADAKNGYILRVSFSDFSGDSEMQVAYNDADKESSEAWTKYIDYMKFNDDLYDMIIGQQSAQAASASLRASKIENGDSEQGLPLRHLQHDGLYLKGHGFNVINVELFSSENRPVITALGSVASDAPATIDWNAPMEIYTPDGRRVSEMRPGAIYIIRQGAITIKLRR